MKIFFKKSVWLLAAIYIAIWLVIAIAGTVVAKGYKEYIDEFFGLQSYNYIDEGGSSPESTNYYKSAFVTEGGALDSQALWDYSVTLAERAQAEGSVELWNNGAVPLSSGAAVSCFGRASGDNGTVSEGFKYSGLGSGTSFNDNLLYADAPTVYTALGDAGLRVNKTLFDWYCEQLGGSYKSTNRSTVNEIPWDITAEAAGDTFASYGDAAIMFIGRYGGENGELSPTGADTDGGDILQLHPNEKRIIEELISLKKSGTFAKVILLLNTASAINGGALSAYRADIDACIWIGQSGYVGLNAVGDILSGNGNAAASGHLPFLMPMYACSAPAALCGQESYVNAEEFGLTPGEVTADSDYRASYMAYTENIYVGYKYYETRYEDAVTGKGNASSGVGSSDGGDWTYAEEVAFPFGWSARDEMFSYGDFTAEEKADGGRTVKLTVTNNGAVAADDVVQIYVQKPYTSFDSTNGIEQSAVSLCAYARTPVIGAGGSVQVTIDVAADAFKTYDSVVNKTYIREGGEDAPYFITAASDSHEAVNNILAAKGYTTQNNAVMDGDGDASLAARITFPSTDTETFSSSVTGEKITNRFDHADWNKFASETQGRVTQLTRKDWSGTFPTGTRLYLDQATADALATNVRMEQEGYPAEDKFPQFNKKQGIVLVSLKGREYDDPMWDSLLDQLTIEEYATLLHGFNGSATIGSIAKPKERVYDGPLGCRGVYSGEVNGGSHRGMTFPIAPVIAATFDDELIRLIGDAKGEGLLHIGASGLYGTAMNIIRTHYGGRNYEYYSEDPYLSGRAGMLETAGLQGKNLKGEEKGTFVTLKHFVLNEHETHRYGIATYLNEQSMRELYLAAFEPSVTVAHARSVMTSFARVGTRWAGGDRALMTDVLRGEWGFEGYAVSDGNRRDYMGVKDALYAGNDFLLNASVALDTEYADLIKSDPTYAHFARESVHRILYVTVNCPAINGFASTTRIVPVTNWWENLLLGVEIALGVLLAAAVTMYVLCFVFGNKKAIERYGERKQAKLSARVVKYGSVQKAQAVARRNTAIVVITSVVAALLVIAYFATSLTLSFTALPRTFAMTGLRLEVSADALYEGANVDELGITVAGVYEDGRMKRLDASDAKITYFASDGSEIVPENGKLVADMRGIRAEYNGFTAQTEIDVRPAKQVFEAEDAIIDAPSGKARTGQSSTASGGRYVSDLVSESTDASVTFYIRADRASRAELFVTVADSTVGSYYFDQFFTVTLNDEKVSGSSIKYDKQGANLTTKWSENKYAEIDLEKGVNVLKFARGATGTNFDCISLSCDAILSDAAASLEAEDALITGVSYGKTAYSTASGGYYVDKIYKNATDIVFGFDSSESASAVVYASFSRSSVASDLATMVDELVVNDVSYRMGEQIQNVSFGTGSHYGFSSVPLCTVELKEGSNTVVLSVPGGGNINFYNFDRLIVITEAEITAVRKANALEAENAAIDGTVNIKTGTQNNPSGGAWAENPGRGGTFTFTVTAEKAGEFDAYLRLGSYGTTPDRTRKLSAVFDLITINGSDYTIGEDIPDMSFTGAGSSKYYEWSLADLGKIALIEGENTITIRKADAADWLNFDCLLLFGPQTLTAA